MIGYAVSNQRQGDDFVEILLQPGTWFHGEENNLEKLEDRINELEQILKQEANKNNIMKKISIYFFNISKLWFASSIPPIV